MSVSIAHGVVAVDPVPSGGTTGQALVKQSDSDYDFTWSSVVYPGTLGSMAYENSNNISVSGGAIDGTTIGGTTPAEGTFTMLTATGQTDVGGSSALAMRFTQATSTVMRAAAVGASVAEIRWSVPSFHTFFTGSNATLSSEGAAQFRVNHTASAVNYVQVTGGATTAAPVISAQGSDAAVPLSFSTKATGSIRFYSGSLTYTQFRIDGTNSASNYLQVQGSTSGNAPILSAQGTDTNISMAFLPKGTGAIDLAAGSSGVNISNGGTVTAITRTAPGSGYTSNPTITISAPTTVGGVQATASGTYNIWSTPITSGGTGYSVNDTITLQGGTYTDQVQLTVTSVSGGVITGVTVLTPSFGIYSVIPTNPCTVTGGTGTGATFSPTWSVRSLAITNAGSGYVEQPTVTFSGGGGSGAAAYATVGSGTTVRSLGGQVEFFSDNTNILHLRAKNTSGGYATNISAAFGMTPPQSNFGAPVLGFISSPYYVWGGTGAAFFQSAAANPQTSGNSGTSQFAISHTASAVNYVQVTGAATGVAPIISAQGSDSNIEMRYNGKGTSGHLFYNGNGYAQFRVFGNVSAANYATVVGAVSGSAPVFSVAGSDTNIDLALTPKGTGNVRFGTYTANMALTVQGYIEIKDAGGTIRKLAVIA